MVESELCKKQRKSLGASKGHVTVAIKNCMQIVNATQGYTSQSLQSAIKTLNGRWDIYEQRYFVLDDTLQDEDCLEEVSQAELEKYEAQRAIYDETIVKCNTMIAKLESEERATETRTTQSHQSLKLPPVQLPKFSGDQLEFETFWDQFNAQIGRRLDLEPVNKLSYLKSMLQGSALELIKNFPSTDASYNLAIQLLQRTYGDETRVKVALLNKILNLPQAKHCYKDLEAFMLALENLSQYLKSKHDYSCCEWIIATIYQNKLPGEMIQQLYNRHHKHQFTIKEMSEGVRNMLEHMRYESAVRSKPEAKSTTVGSVPKETKKSDATAVGTYTVSHSDSRAHNVRVCQLCSGEHSASRCQKYVSVSNRLQRIKSLKLCERCLGKHHTSTCSVKLRKCPKCWVGKHHSVLCQSQSPQSTNNTEPTRTLANPSGNPNANHCGVAVAASRVTQSTGALPTAMAELIQDSSHQVRLFFDAGSQMTFITREVVERANIPIAEVTHLTLSGFMSPLVTGDFPVIKTTIRIGKEIIPITATVVETLPTQIRTVGLTRAIQQLQAMGIVIADPHVENDTVGPVDILIGSDQYYEFTTNLTVVREGIHLIETAAGHSLTGPLPRTCLPSVDEAGTIASMENMVVVMKVTDIVNPLHKSETVLEPEAPIHKLWDLDVIGIDITKAPPDESRSYRDYLDTVQYHNGQYWVKLPWRTNKPELPVNYRKALGQMYSLVRELQKKDDHLQLYSRIISDQLKAQFIEEVPQASPSDTNVHYLPHHAVVKDSVTTPLRIVFNCSAKEGPQSASLNECLMTGPSLTEKIGDVLMKFRTGRFAYTADISKAFLRVGLQEEDRDYTRFLWPENPDSRHSCIKTYRFRSVLFGATSSPFLLQATLDYHLKNSTCPLRHDIASQLYIDNLQGGTSDEQYLMDIYAQANRELQQANMPLQQWTTNHPTLKTRIEEDFPGYQVPDSSGILGLQWTITNDELSMKPVVSVQNQKGLTKRSLLANVSKAFDPLGLFTPITIKGKMLIQKAWEMNANWDETLPDSLIREWEAISAEFSQLHTLHVPRKIGEQGESCKLHIFCDASSAAYGAVAYLSNPTAAYLVTSKARVRPLKIKSRTVPQLELTAILVGTKLGVYVNRVLQDIEIQHTYIWSDSEVALQWLRNDKSKLVYVQNRVAEIHEIKSNFSFLHIDSKNNPADLLSRGLTLSKLQGNSLWFHGPDWLPNETQWPEQKNLVVSDGEVVCSVSVQEPPPEVPPDLQAEPIDPKRFSSLAHLLRVTTLVFRFINALYQRTGVHKRLPFSSALEFWIKHVQRENYPSELKVLENNSGPLSCQLLRKHRIIKDLGLYLDQRGILRCRGRLHNSELKYATKHPILIPKTSWLSQLIILEAHAAVLHGGVCDTLTHIRQQFWIPQGRQSVKTCLRQCKTCIRYDGRTCQYPGPPPLPIERVRQSRPFEITGVDYTGALTITDDPSGEPVKVYICLFTCATTRAVHLELALDLSADTFLKLFRRFAARRSCPRLIISDNGTNLKAVGSFLKSYFDLPEVRRFFNYRRCEWRFIPPRAPWQGGFYERCIGIVKRCLRKVLHGKKITIEELRTLLAEIETRVNNRPLTYVNEGIDDPVALTPSHLLTGDRIEPVPPVPFHGLQEDPDFRMSPEVPTVEKLNECFKKHTKLLMKWNKVWREDYLTSLREHHYGATQPTSSNPLKPGDIVLVECESSRADWPLGRVVSIHPDESGTLRLVKVRSRGITSLRTVEKLIPFEISPVEPDTPQLTSLDASTGQSDRPSRSSAQRARSHWRGLHSEGAI